MAQRICKSPALPAELSTVSTATNNPLAIVPTEFVAATALPLASSATNLPMVRVVAAATLKLTISIPVDLASCPIVAAISSHLALF